MPSYAEELSAAGFLYGELYEGQILNTHMAINFSDAEKELYHTVFDFLVKWFFSKEIDLVLLGIDLVRAVSSAITKIEDTDYCIFARIIELCIGNKEKLFCENDIKTANRDGKCDYQEENWKCTYFGEQENCTCNKRKIALAFQSLKEQKIIREVGERWMLVW